MLTFGSDVCRDLNAGLDREWLETNGIGGFSSSTIAGVNTRRYHGLLTAALHPPVDRHVLLSKLEETLFAGGNRYELATNLYAGAVHPEGYKLLASFRLDPFPIFTWVAGDVEIEKRVFMAQGENTTVIEYEVIRGGSCTLAVFPLIAFRDYHATTHANPEFNPAFQVEAGRVFVKPYADLPRLCFAHNAGVVSSEAYWVRNFEYPRERERGLDYSEDLYQPFVLHFGMNEVAVVIASTETRSASDAQALREREVTRKTNLAARSADPLVSALTAAADQFTVRRAGDLHTLIAGYHWFTDWGRDTMIALPGLTLATGRFDVARGILLAFSGAVSQGMLPNRFPDAGAEPEYNTVDGSLWYFETIRQFHEHTGDSDFVRARLYPTMKEIIGWHLRGTRYGIRCGEDGLISAGTAETQLTWMDSRSGDRPVTPRNGKAVEIQALWFNALRVTEGIARGMDDTAFADRLAEVAGRASKNFNALFWNEAAGCLYDVVDGDIRDASIRPNQAIALSLGYTMIGPDRALKIVSVLRKQLLTPFGLRTLSPSDPKYIGAYNGDAAQREASYHQGSVWPWLIGPWVSACDRFGQNPGQWAESFTNHLNIAGLNTVSELFDGDEPHYPRGCIAQAWSVGNILLCYTTKVFARIS